jgi:hypothetical protein
MLRDSWRSSSWGCSLDVICSSEREPRVAFTVALKGRHPRAEQSMRLSEFDGVRSNSFARLVRLCVDWPSFCGRHSSVFTKHPPFTVCPHVPIELRNPLAVHTETDLCVHLHCAAVGDRDHPGSSLPRAERYSTPRLLPLRGGAFSRCSFCPDRTSCRGYRDAGDRSFLSEQPSVLHPPRFVYSASACWTLFRLNQGRFITNRFPLEVLHAHPCVTRRRFSSSSFFAGTLLFRLSSIEFRNHHRHRYGPEWCRGGRCHPNDQQPGQPIFALGSD